MYQYSRIARGESPSRLPDLLECNRSERRSFQRGEMNPIGKTNKRLRQFVKCTVQNLGDIRLNEQAFGFHTQVVLR